MGSNEKSKVVFLKHWRYISISLSSLCGILIILHAIYPQYSIDTTTIALIIILVFPWLLPYIKTLKLPGGTELTFRDEIQELEKLAEKSEISRITAPSPPVLSAAPSRSQLCLVDPNLALASLRIEIERKVRDIAGQKGVEIAHQRISLRLLLNKLHSSGIIPTSEFKILNLIIDVCNRAVHAEKVNVETASEILDIGESAILYLDSLLN